MVAYSDVPLTGPGIPKLCGPGCVWKSVSRYLVPFRQKGSFSEGSPQSGKSQQARKVEPANMPSLRRLLRRLTSPYISCPCAEVCSGVSSAAPSRTSDSGQKPTMVSPGLLYELGLFESQNYWNELPAAVQLTQQGLTVKLKNPAVAQSHKTRCPAGLL